MNPADREAFQLQKVFMTCFRQHSRSRKQPALLACIHCLSKIQMRSERYSLVYAENKIEKWEELVYHHKEQFGDTPERVYKGLRSQRGLLGHGKHATRHIQDFTERTLDTTDPNTKSLILEIQSERQVLFEVLETSISSLKDRIELLSNLISTESSIRSMAMASEQIAGSKRVRLLTVLAFIFLPISLASSIFGMNIQEINGTGKNIWWFVVISFALIGLVMLVWLVAVVGIRVFHAWVQSYIPPTREGPRAPESWKRKMDFRRNLRREGIEFREFVDAARPRWRTEYTGEGILD
ncbi:uncharacterized protein K452DRAFT_78876 [Aplosporella prunicola CBS 121167]|uniref:Uncharacterized protein n=1 Tax=Aplosporella prunicola CBS 121167 TaxID=1176127 RepID=A0A6A6B6D3_9PEZI|nr:uncharacterized protein K452DRAFT_78876 [Aplosporella prunicola CBS 121167]KAF2138973.1 hypothetical protein K452DRAFT_78876 [Aplosporella prunicola CBS 121167]